MTLYSCIPIFMIKFNKFQNIIRLTLNYIICVESNECTKFGGKADLYFGLLTGSCN
jgi:hypothetical protein